MHSKETSIGSSGLQVCLSLLGQGLVLSGEEESLQSFQLLQGLRQSSERCQQCPCFLLHPSNLNGCEAGLHFRLFGGPEAEKPPRKRPEKVIHGTLAKGLVNSQRLLIGFGRQAREI